MEQTSPREITTSQYRAFEISSAKVFKVPPPTNGSAAQTDMPFFTHTFVVRGNGAERNAIYGSDVAIQNDTVSNIRFLC